MLRIERHVVVLEIRLRVLFRIVAVDAKFHGGPLVCAGADCTLLTGILR